MLGWAQAGYVSLESLMAHLWPADDDLRAAHEEGRKRMGEAVARIGIISLTGNAEQQQVRACRDFG
jgi:hypothetical protein